MIIPEVTEYDQKAFMGVGYGNPGVPLDILPIYFLGLLLEDFSILVVDEFLRLNGVPEEQVSCGLDELINTLTVLSELYGVELDSGLSSEFMSSSGYLELFGELKESVEVDRGIKQRVVGLVPENKRHNKGSLEYPIHEFACVQLMSDQGQELKLGPVAEKKYDEIMAELGVSIDFGYILDAFALGTKYSDPIVHYSPRSGVNTQRIYFQDRVDQIKSKLMQGNRNALLYFCNLASVSRVLLGEEPLDLDYLTNLSTKRLRKKAVGLVIDNVVKPIKEVASYV